MNKSKLTLRYHDLYIEGIAIGLMIISFSVPFCLLILCGYVYWQRKTMRWQLFAVIVVLLLSRYFLFSSHQQITYINDSVKVVDIDRYETSSRLTIRYKTHRYHVYVYDDEIQLGDIIYVNGDIDTYEKVTIPNGFNANSYYLSQNVIGKINVKSLSFVRHEFSIFSLRERLMDHTKTIHQSFVNSFIFGKDQLEDELSDPFREANLLFLCQTTGLHAYVLVLLIKKIMFYFDFGENTQQSVIISIYGLLCYLNGFAIGVTRLLFSQIFNVINKRFRLRLTPLDRIFIIGFIMIIISFQWVYSIGFLMTNIILLTLELARDRYQSYQGYVKRIVMSFLIVLACLPFTGLVNPLIMICLPLLIIYVTGIVYPLSFVAFFTTRLDDLMGLLLNGLTRIVDIINSTHLTYYLPSLDQWQILLYYTLFIYLLFAYKRYQLLIRLTLISALFGFKLVTNRYMNDASVYFLDVGQGDTTYIETRSCQVMIDSFSGSTDFLKHQGINQLDILFLTHSDSDHTKEASQIVHQIGADRIVINPYDDGYEDYPTQVIKAKPDQYLSCGNLSFHILGQHHPYDEANLNSLVIQVTIEEDVYLFTGDIHKEVEQDLIAYYGHDLKSDILKIAHHGSTTSTSSTFIEYVQPSYAIIFAGRHNRFDFPHQETINSLLYHHIITYRTDQLGTIIITYKNMQRLWEATLPISTEF